MCPHVPRGGTLCPQSCSAVARSRSCVSEGPISRRYQERRCARLACRVLLLFFSRSILDLAFYVLSVRISFREERCPFCACGIAALFGPGSLRSAFLQ